MFVIDEKNCSKIYTTHTNENGETIYTIQYDKDYLNYKKYEFLLDQNYDDYESSQFLE